MLTAPFAQGSHGWRACVDSFCARELWRGRACGDSFCTRELWRGRACAASFCTRELWLGVSLGALVKGKQGETGRRKEKKETGSQPRKNAACRRCLSCKIFRKNSSLLFCFAKEKQRNGEFCKNPFTCYGIFALVKDGNKVKRAAEPRERKETGSQPRKNAACRRCLSCKFSERNRRFCFALQKKSDENKGLCPFRLFQAAGADVALLLLSVLHEGDLLDVCLERSSRSALGMADVVAARLPLTADTAYSRHMKHLRSG